jgi:hypothetical protein
MTAIDNRPWPQRDPDDTAERDVVVNIWQRAQHANRPGHQTSWLSRLRRTDQAITGAVIAAGQPADRCGEDARTIAGQLRTGGPVAVTPGKGVDFPQTNAAFDDNDRIGLNRPANVVLMRPRGETCWVSDCGQPGVVHLPDDDRVWCTGCQPIGVLGIVDGGGAA